METGVVTIQEPVSTKTNIEEAPAEVILGHSSLKVDKVTLSTVLDDEITSHDCENSTIPGEAELVNGSGNKETEESEREKGEAMKTILVEEDNKIVKEKASEAEKDEQGFIFVHEPESFNKNIEEDAKIILSDVTLEKEDDITQKPEEVREEIPIKTDEVKEEKDSRTVETSVNGTEAEQKATVSVEEISRNGENIVNETVQEQETATNSESLDGVETTKRVLLEVKEEEEEAEKDAEPLIKTVVQDANIVSNEETTAHESESFKENVKPAEAVKNADDAEQISREVTVDKDKEEDIEKNTEEVQESVRVIETPTIQGEDIESKDHEKEIKKISKDTDEHEQELVRDIPQGETFVTEAETVDTSTVQETEILKTNINETEENNAMGGEEEGEETKENTKLSQGLKEDKEQEETEIVKTIISSDEVRSCDVQVKEFGENIEPRSLEIKDESHGREESVELKTKETVQEESTAEKHENFLDVQSTHEPETSLVASTESRENFEDIPSDLAIDVDKEERKDEKINVNQVDETQIMEEQRGLDSDGAEAEQIDRNRTDETEEIPVEKVVALPDVESVEQIQKPSLESPSEVSEETSKTIDEKIEEKPESKELGEQAHKERTLTDLTPLPEESCLPNEQEKETKLENHEPTNEEVIEVSSALPSKELVGETVVEAEKIEKSEEKEEEQVAGKIPKSLETVETVESHSSLPSSLEEEEHGTISEKIEDEKVKEEEPMVHIKSEEDTTKTHEKQEESFKDVEIKETTVFEAEQTRDIEPSLTENRSMDQSQPDECSGDEQKKEVSRNSENETYASHSAEAVAEEAATNGESPLHDAETTKREGSVEVKSKETVEDNNTEEKHENLLDIPSTESVKYQYNEPEKSLVAGTESQEKFEEIPSDLALNVDKVDETQIMEEQRGLDSNGAEAEQVDQNRADETEESPVANLVVLPDVEEPVEQMQKPSLESPSEVSEERSKTVDEKIEEEITLHREGQDEGSFGLETVSVPVSKELEERTLIDLTPLQVESSQPNEQDKETILEKHETTNEEVSSESFKGDDNKGENAESVEAIKISDDAEQISSEVTGDREKEDDHHEENAELVEAIKNSDDAEQISHEVTVDREMEEDMTKKTEELQESSTVIETLTTQGEEIESKASLELKEEVDQSSKDTEEHEHVLGREIPQCENIEAEPVEAKEDTKPILDKEDKEQELKETAKIVIFSDEVIPSDQVDVQADEFAEHTELCSSEIKDESHGREESVEEIVQDESTEEKHENILDVPPTIESEKFQDNEPKTSLVANKEIGEKFEETPSDLVLSIDKEELKDEEIKVDQVDGTQIMEEQRGLDSNVAEAEHIDRNRTDETEESPLVNLVVLPNVESVEQIQKPSLESPSEVIEETSKTIDENIEEKSEEETVSVPEESSKPNEQDKETILEKHEPTKEEVSCERFKGDDNKGESAESVEAIKNSDDAEQISSEVIGDIEEEEDITQKVEKVQESPLAIETPREDIELEEEVDQSSKDIEEHENVLGRDILQCETLEAEAVDTTTVQEAVILKTLETNINETEAVHSEIGEAEEIQETKEDTEVKDESQGREEAVETKSKETVQDENSEDKDVNLLDVRSGESEKCQENEPETTLVSEIESQEKFEEIPSDLALKDELMDEKPKADQVDETQTMEVQRGLDLNEPKAEQVDQNRTDETEESPVAKLVVVEDSGLDETAHNQTLLDVESVEKVQNSSLEIPPELSEETSKTVDEKIEDKPKEEVTLHQEDQEESSYGLETKEERVSVPEESCLPNETMLQEKSEPTKEEVSNDQQSPAEETSDEVIQVSSASTSEEREGETVVEVEKIVDEKVDKEEQVAEKIQKSLEPVEKVEAHSSLQEHATVSEKIDDEKVEDVERMGDTSEKGLEITETTDLSIPSFDQNKEIKAFDEEIQIPSVALPLDEQEKVTSTEKEETKENETAEAKKEDEQKEVCIQQEEFGKLEVPKLEESKEDKRQENVETIKAIEATSDQILPIETSDADNTLSSELVSEEKDQTPKLVEEIHEEEPEEAHKLQAEEIFPVEITPRESSDEVLASMLASKKDEKVTMQEDKCADDVRETKDTQDERYVSVETEESVRETKPEDEHVETPASPIILENNDNEIAEANKGDEHINETETTMALDTSCTSATSENVCIKQEEFGNQEAPKLEESKEEKSQNNSEITEAKEATGDQTLPIETSQEDQTLSSELVSRVDDQTPRHVEEIHEEETKEEHKFEAILEQSLPVETSQEYQTPSSDLASELDDQTLKQVDEEETKQEHKLQVDVGKILPVETSQEDQTPSLVKEILEEETKETVPRESFSEAPVSMLASGEDEPVTPQESNYAGDDTHEERHVSAETEESVEDTKPKEPEVEEKKKSDDQVETSTKLTEVEDENTKKMDTEVAELTDYSTVEAEQEDENSSNLPVVEILKGLHQFPLETEREINDSASSGENLIKKPADQEQKKDNAEVENKKDSASDIIEEVKVQDGISREFEVNVEEKLQEETREISESKEEVPSDLSLTEVLPVVKYLTPSSPLPSEELEDVISNEKQEEREPQQDVNVSISEKISLQEEQKEKKAETHETVKEEDEIVENIEEKKSEEEQVEKLWDSSATRDIEEIFSSEVKEEKKDLGKEEASHSVLGSEEEINEVVTSEKQITDPVGVIMKASEAEHESNEEHIETQVILDDTKINDDRDFLTEQAPKDQRDEVSVDKSFTKEALSEQLQVPSSTVLDDIQKKSEQEPVADLADRDLSVRKPSELIQLEEKVEVKKAGDDKNEETRDALITKENLQVQGQPNDLEASVTDKETSEQEQSNNLEEDIGTNVKLEVHDDEVRCDSHDSVAESKEVEHVETELEDAIKHGVSVEEKNNASEKIDREVAKEISQEESKQTNTVKEEITEEEKETNQECFKKTDDVIDLTQTETRDIEILSSVSKTQDNPEQKDEVPIQKTREIADDVPKIAEEVQQKDEESELFSEVKESEPTEKESARESLSDLVQNVKGTTKNEDTTTEPHIEEKLKTEEEESEDEHNKDDKTSPDSLEMVEAKDTVSIIKTHKKSQGILSGVGSKVKHSISKVKKVLTGKSSHTTTKPSSPK